MPFEVDSLSAWLERRPVQVWPSQPPFEHAYLQLVLRQSHPLPCSTDQPARKKAQQMKGTTIRQSIQTQKVWRQYATALVLARRPLPLRLQSLQGFAVALASLQKAAHRRAIVLVDHLEGVESAHSKRSPGRCTSYLLLCPRKQKLQGATVKLEP